MSCAAQKEKKDELNLYYNYTDKGLLVQNNENELDLNSRKAKHFLSRLRL